MSNVKKPEPVAVICDTYELRYVSCDPVTFIINRTGAKIGSRLITTDQAEAYKDACVREALEQAAGICKELQCSPELTPEVKDNWLAIAEKRIRELMQKGI